MEMPLNFCNIGFKVLVIEITVAGTTQTSGGQVLQEAVALQQ